MSMPAMMRKARRRNKMTPEDGTKRIFNGFLFFCAVLVILAGIAAAIFKGN